MNPATYLQRSQAIARIVGRAFQPGCFRVFLRGFCALRANFERLLGARSASKGCDSFRKKRATHNHRELPRGPLRNQYVETTEVGASLSFSWRSRNPCLRCGLPALRAKPALGEYINVLQSLHSNPHAKIPLYNTPHHTSSHLITPHHHCVRDSATEKRIGGTRMGSSRSSRILC